MAGYNSRTDEPIAIIGMACRFPGADNYDAYWRLLSSGTMIRTEGRVGEGPGRMGEFLELPSTQSDITHYGAFINDIDKFDAEFFRIAPIEAQLLDPQQRLMLETSWRALEDAGIDPESLRGTRAGVYGGISNNEYRYSAVASIELGDPATSLYAASGSTLNTAIGRISYTLGLEGPALAIDTACSSSLVATHQAVVGLQRGEADIALAGGVNAMLSGRVMFLRRQAGMLSPNGICRTFDEAADGYLRGEGCGILVLKRLSDAERDGDRIWGIIRGSAINQDGASQGLTVPSASAQENVIRDALASAGLTAVDVDYLEAHGTATPVGDPPELQAAAAAYGSGRPTDQPMIIGSVKTNFGHLEPASGVAGMMKVILGMRRGVIPKHLNFENPTTAIDWETANLRVPTEAMDWPHVDGRPPRAAVSGFGWSGTNAHVIVEGYGAPAAPSLSAGRTMWPTGASVEVGTPDAITVADIAPRQTRILPLSAKTPETLRELAGRYLDQLSETSGGPSPDTPASDPALSDLAWTTTIGRSHFRYRAAIPFRDAASLREGLDKIAASDSPRQPAGAPTKIGFVFTGQNSQWVGMAQALYESEPVARDVLDRCEAIVQSERGESLLDVIFGRGGDLDDSRWAQPAVYAVECALTALWKIVGVEPSVVAGHSLGEFAAAQAAGAYSLEDGMRLTTARGELMSSLPPGAAMGAVFATQAAVEAAIVEQQAISGDTRLTIGLDNAINQVVSGGAEDVEAILQRFEAEDVRVRRLTPGPAFHSAFVEPMLEGQESAFSEILQSPRAPQIPLICDYTGRPLEEGEVIDAAYWRRHARQKVLFRSSIESMAEMGVDFVIEIGPGMVLGPVVSLAWPPNAPVKDPPVLSSMIRPPHDETEPPVDATRGFISAVAVAYEAGVPIDFPGLLAGESRRRVIAPGYPFQRHRHWIDPTAQPKAAAGHPLLGVRHDSPRGEVTFESRPSSSNPAWLSDHRVFGRVIAPGAMYAAMGLTAARANYDGIVALDDTQIPTAMVFADAQDGEAPESTERSVQVILEPRGKDGGRGFEIYSTSNAQDDWTLHVRGSALEERGLPDGVTAISPGEMQDGLRQIDIAEFYRSKAEIRIDFGPLFQAVTGLWAGNGTSFGEVTLPDELVRSGLDFHPVLLDGCVQAASAARLEQIGNDLVDSATYLPFAWERLWVSGPLPSRVFCHTTMRERASDAATDSRRAMPEVYALDVTIYSPDGDPLGGIIGLTVKRATREALFSANEGVSNLVYDIVWQDRPLFPLQPADFLAEPTTVQAATPTFEKYLSREGVDWNERVSLLADLERLSQSFALDAVRKLGCHYAAGEVIDPEALSDELDIMGDRAKLFRRVFELLGRAGVMQETAAGFQVLIGPDDPLPADLPPDPDAFAASMLERYPHGSIEIALCQRTAAELPGILRRETDPLTVLFGSGYPTPGDLFNTAPATRAVNTMLGDAVAALINELPDGRTLRIVEVGAGTGSGTASVLPQLPAGRFEYAYTDISAGFFAEAEARFGTADGAIDYRPLDIEKDPVEQGFDPHGYDLVIASNVLHDTISLNETLLNCMSLLAPSGHLVAIEALEGMGWQDVTFGALEGWWRFDDQYRPNHGIANADVWTQALADTGFEDPQVLGLGSGDSSESPDRSVFLARAPAVIPERPGTWVIAPDNNGLAEELATELAEQNQSVTLADIDVTERGAWRTLFEGLPENVPLRGVVHLIAASGHGSDATTEEMSADVQHASGSALAMVQGLLDADVTPSGGTWIITRGGQSIGREPLIEPAGAALWGLGKVLIREVPALQARMIDLDADGPLGADLVEGLLRPDGENHVAWRRGYRQAARLVRGGDVTDRLSIPEGSGWLLMPDESGDPDRIYVDSAEDTDLEPWQARVTVDAVGLNFRDVLLSIGMEDATNLGLEFMGRVTEVGADVTRLSPGDRVIALSFETLAAETVVHEQLIAHAPETMSTRELATVPTAYTTALRSYEFAGLGAGDRVLIHAASGGVGMAAVAMAQAAGAEIFATASSRKQAYLRELGIDHIYDSRSTLFGQQILEDTGGAGVDIVLNSLTGEGFIDASLSCLAQGGRFVELAREGILTEEEMATARPDVKYHILKNDELKVTHPEVIGTALRGVVEQLDDGKLGPIPHTAWSMAEVPAAIKFMRDTLHVGKIVVTNSPLQSGSLRADRTYLVTGGLGGIGTEVARWLADKGAGAIVLNGRRDPDPEAQQVIDELREAGVTVQVELADVTDGTAIDAMLARIDESLPPLAGVIHSVGVLSDASLANQTWESFEQVLSPKVLGAWQLHRGTLNRDLDMFILFSSAAGVFGNPGQANHAAANAFLDQLAGHRRALGLAGQTIAWGAWSDIGEAAEQRERIEEQLAERGTLWMSPEEGMRAFDWLVRQDWTNATVTSIEWESFLDSVGFTPPLFTNFERVDSDEGAGSADAGDNLLDRLGSVAVEEREQVLIGFLQKELQSVMRMPSQPTPVAEFSELGMDSLMAVELRNRINRALIGAYVAPNTVVFDYPSIARLAAHVAGDLGEIAPSAAPIVERPAAPLPTPVVELSAPPPPPRIVETPAAPPRVRTQADQDAIAIVGMACRFPGAENLDAFWRLLEAGRSAVTDGRADGGDWTGLLGDPNAENSYERHGAFLRNIDEFDSRFFRIQPIEARTMDPQQRLLLETAWQALEDAGIDPDGLRGSQTGVYAGISGSEYRSVLANNGGGDIFGTLPSMAIGRIAFTLGLQGPAVPVDLACTSSLAAVHQGAAAIRNNEVDLALAGGVSIILSPSTSRYLAELGILSPSGKTASFDASGDGFVRGEGCGFVVLKRLEQAEADGDRIWGVIRGSAVNQNGAGFSMISPNGAAQQTVMRDALDRSGLAPSDIDYLEAHGTGTPLGDSIEVNAVASVYGRDREADHPLIMGSVKTNMGHLEAASGMASLIKVVLAMKHRLIPRHLNFTTPNPEIDWDNLPLRIPAEEMDWPAPADRPAMAAINVFGMTGANAHVVVEGYEHATRHSTPTATPKARLLPLSAKDDAALRNLAERYRDWLDTRVNGGAEDANHIDDMLADMAWTASVGRSHFPARAGVVFTDADDLRTGLQRVIDGSSRADAAAADGDAGSVSETAREYEAGQDINFVSSFAGETRQKIAVPGYPFQRRRYWAHPKNGSG